MASTERKVEVNYGERWITGHLVLSSGNMRSLAISLEDGTPPAPFGIHPVHGIMVMAFRHDDGHWSDIVSGRSIEVRLEEAPLSGDRGRAG